MGQAALDYARRGWPVFPCRPRPETIVVQTKDGPKDRLYKEKSPLVGKGGLNVASKDERVITDWWRRWPDAMIGLPIGEIGWFALDFDPRREEIIDPDTGEITGVEEWTLEQLKAATEAQIGCTLPASLAVRTPSGGVHVYYQQPREGDLIRNRGNLPLHVDVRGRGGYVCLPPSIVIEGDNPGRYRWLHGRHDTAPVAAPQALTDVLRAPKAAKAGPTKNVGGDQPPAASSAARAPATFSDDPGDVQVRKYALAALDDECRKLAAAPKGHRNIEINARSFAIGQLVGAGALQESMVRAAIQAIVMDMPHDGGDPSGALQTIENGLTAGMAQPRDLSEIAAKARERAERGSRAPPPRAAAAAAPAPRDDAQGRLSSHSGRNGGGDHDAGSGGELARACAWLPLTDLGNSERFRQRFGREFLWVAEWGWLAWDGRRWNREHADAMVARAVYDTVRAIGEEAAFIRDSGRKDWLFDTVDGQDVPAEPKGRYDFVVKVSRGGDVTLFSDTIAAWGRTSESAGRLGCIANLAQPYLSARPADFDADPMKINLANGTMTFLTPQGSNEPAYRFEAGKFRRRDRITKIAAAAFDPSATCPTYDAFLTRVQPDEAMRDFLHAWGGYNLTGDISSQKMALFYGEGANGKSTWIDTVAYIIGDYARTCGIETFIDQGRHRKGGDATPDLAALAGARMVRTSEPEQGSKFSDGLIKAMTGGEPLNVRELNKGFFEMLVTFKVTASANVKPAIGTDHGIKRRVRLIPWDVIIPEEERDETLTAKLKAEASGVLNYLVAGTLAWMRHGLPEPQAVKDATREYQEENDPVGRFLEQCTAKAPGERLQSSTLYDLFKAWQIASGEVGASGKPWSQKYLSGQMKKKGHKSTQSNVIWWLDLRMTREVGDFVDDDWKPRKEASAPLAAPPPAPPYDDDEDGPW